MTSINNAHQEDWIEIKHIGKMKPQYIDHQMQRTNFSYNTSGSICVSYKVMEDETVHIFTFVDLVNKISFESRIVYTQDYIDHENNLKVDGVYFCSENEIVVVTAIDGMVKQMVYKIDFANQSRKLQETITHKFIRHDVFKRHHFTFQRNNIVNFNGIDYILMIAYNCVDISEDEYSATKYSMYLVPMNPKDKDTPTKEFLFRFKPTDEITEKIRDKMEPFNDHYGIENAEYYANLVCLVGANKLCFHFSASSENTGHFIRLIGVYGEVDLTKLRDISKEKLRTEEDLRLLFEEQEDAFELIDAGDFHVAFKNRCCYEFDFYHSDYNIGTVYIYRKKDNNNVHMTLINSVGSSKTSVMDCKVMESLYGPSRGSNIYDRLTIHPHGALLHFKIENGSIRFRLLKNFKMNLKSLSFNMALFHKDTPIKHHPAYRLCFNRTKPVEYVIKKKRNLKRKRRY